MCRSLLFSSVERLITGSVQTETEWPPVRRIAEGSLGRWETGLVTSQVLPNPIFCKRATVEGHYHTSVYVTIYQHITSDSLPHGAGGEPLSTR